MAFQDRKSSSVSYDLVVQAFILRAVLAGGTFPGPLIQASKVLSAHHLRVYHLPDNMAGRQLFDLRCQQSRRCLHANNDQRRKRRIYVYRRMADRPM